MPRIDGKYVTKEEFYDRVEFEEDGDFNQTDELYVQLVDLVQEDDIPYAIELLEDLIDSVKYDVVLEINELFKENKIDIVLSVCEDCGQVKINDFC